MFLNHLSLTERETFLDLVYYVAHVDGDFAEEEQLMLQNYQVESGLHYYNPKTERSLDEMITVFNDKKSQHAVFIEIVGLMLADHHIAPEEQTVLNQMKDSFKLSAEKVIKMIQWVQDYYQICQDGIALIDA